MNTRRTFMQIMAALPFVKNNNVENVYDYIPADIPTGMPPVETLGNAEPGVYDEVAKYKKQCEIDYLNNIIYGEHPEHWFSNIPKDVDGMEIDSLKSVSLVMKQHIFYERKKKRVIEKRIKNAKEALANLLMTGENTNKY